MFRPLTFARRKYSHRLASATALAMTLAAGGVAGSAVLSAPAAAQEYSRDFVELYQPVAETVNAEGGDIASVSGQFAAIAAAADSADEQLAAGQLIVSAGTKIDDPQLQRQGLELMLNSGKTPPDRVGPYNFYLGQITYNAKEYATARAAFEAALAAGYSDPQVDIPGLIAETYFAEGNGQGGIEYVRTAAAERVAAGGQVPERWLLRALQSAYEMNLTSEATELSGMLVENYPTERNWINSLQVVAAMNTFDDDQRLDLLRLMRETGALTQRAEYVRYIEAADPRIMSNEVDDVLAAAVAAGEIAQSDTYYTEVKAIVDQRAGIDRREAPAMIAEAQGSSDASLAVDAGDVAFSLDDFGQAEAMYQMALDKGAADRDMLLTRLGISQAKQAKYAEAKATFEQVGGVRAPIAQMWSIYADTQTG